MEIKTKYSIDDVVWTMKNNKPVSFIVGSIFIKYVSYRDAHSKNQITTYSDNIYGDTTTTKDYISRKEDEIFSTLDGLLDNLKNQLLNQN